MTAKTRAKPETGPSTPADGQAPARRLIRIPTDSLRDNPASIEIYGDPRLAIDDLLESIRMRGILVPLVVTPDAQGWQLLSGHRRLACARALELPTVPCLVDVLDPGPARLQAVVEYNRQRRKTFTHLMREADALETILGAEARDRRRSKLRQFQTIAHDPQRANAAERDPTSGAPDDLPATPDGSDAPAPRPDCRESDKRPRRTDAAIAQALDLGGKDLYRQARAIWKAALSDDPRAQSAVAQLDAGTKTIHAAYKDLRRRDRFSAGFTPTPYDVWQFRHDRAFGIPHPGSIPAGLVAHLLHYYTRPGDLVVDPMAGGGTTLDVCSAMGRRCLAYDYTPVRDDVCKKDVKVGFTSKSRGCDLIFCDPPYHTMLARRYAADETSITEEPLTTWIAFLQKLAVDAFDCLRPGGVVALLLANQTEKDLPCGHGYLDHAFLGYEALRSAGFLPERRISCPMSGGYLPQQVRRARSEGRLLGLVRDLLVMRKPVRPA
jgi:ParB-like chromosome segregation protein Spo0J